MLFLGLDWRYHRGMRKWLIGLFSVLVLALAVGDADAKRRPRGGGLGTLQINSMTEGAGVFVDGKEVGVLPLKEPLRLKPGRHTLKLTKAGYTEYLDVFRVRAGRTTSLDIDLLPFAGVLIVTSTEPDARVFVDGKFVGTAPLEKEVLIGERTVSVKKPGYYDFIKKYKAIGGTTERITADLEAMPVGTTPYRPTPPPPPKWYEKWYVWAGAAGGVAAVTLAVVLPVVLNKPAVDKFDPDYRWSATP